MISRERVIEILKGGRRPARGAFIPHLGQAFGQSTCSAPKFSATPATSEGSAAAWPNSSRMIRWTW